MAYDQEIYNIAIQEGFTPITAKLIVAQARLESSHYDSKVFKANNNMYGMKFVGQPLATRGTLAPQNERSKQCLQSNICKDSDHYAKYKTVTDSAKDTIQRLYKRTLYGVTPEEINKSRNATEFANTLKKRRYFGFKDFNTPEGKEEARKYASVLDSILLRIKVVEVYTKYKKQINYTTIGLLFVAIGGTAYWYYKKKF
jgi:hypothetical protein